MGLPVKVDLSVKYDEETCITCGVVFYVPSEMMRHRKNKHESFYCPSGHSMFYPGATEAEQLRKELDQTKQRLQWAQGERDAAQKKAQKLERRVAKGVCPCCQRTFTNMSRHMATKHPEFPKEVTGNGN